MTYSALCPATLTLPRDIILSSVQHALLGIKAIQAAPMLSAEAEDTMAEERQAMEDLQSALLEFPAGTDITARLSLPPENEEFPSIGGLVS